MEKETKIFLVVVVIIITFFGGLQVGLKDSARRYQTAIAEIKKELSENNKIIVKICTQYPEACIQPLQPLQAQKERNIEI